MLAVQNISRQTYLSEGFNCKSCFKTYTPMQRELACKLYTREDNDEEFFTQLFKNKILIVSWKISGSTLRCVCGEQIFKVLDHEPRRSNCSQNDLAYSTIMSHSLTMAKLLTIEE